MTRVHERRRIYAFLDGRLSERGYVRLEQHLKTCETCRQYLEQVRQARALLASMGDEEPDVDLIRVRRSLLNEIQPSPGRNLVELWSRRALGAAAIAAAAVLAVVLLGPLLSSRAGEDTMRPQNNEPVEVTRTLADASASTGRLTMVGEGTLWRRPGLRWEKADLHTLVDGQTELMTERDGIASVQIAPSSGVRLEPDTRVGIRTLVRDSMELTLDRGTVSVRVSEGSGLRHVQVDTGQAAIQVSSATLSVQKAAGTTRVVVAQGRAHVRALSGSGERVLVGPVVVQVDARGIREVRDDETAQGQRSVKWLLGLHFNLFDQQPAFHTVSFAPQGHGRGVTVSLGGLLVGPAPLSMLAPVGEQVATLSFDGGSSLNTAFSVDDGDQTVVKFTTPHIDVTPSEPALRSPKVPSVPRETELEAAEEPEQVHEGTLHPQIVKLVMKKHRGRLRDCYQEYLDAEPDVIKVKARILFTVGTSGKVVDSSAQTNADDEALSKCLSGAMKNVVFPPPSGGTVQFAYPITFTPK